MCCRSWATESLFLFAHTKYNETQGQISHDGKWIAYVSDESGTSEIYVQAFATGGQKMRVSSAGGVQPRWRRDGRELFFLSPSSGQMMAVSVQTTPDLKPGSPTALFETSAGTSGGLGTTANYDATADGQRFIVASAVNDADNPPITVVVNWTAGLRK